jgi:acyl-CoA thioesterase
MSSHQPPPSEFTEQLGFEYRGVVDGDFVIELVLRPEHMSRAQRAHGGLLFTLLDTCLGRAIIAQLPEGRGCATVEMKINYFRPVQHGRIRARGRLREMTRRLAYAEGEILNEHGKCLARASGTFFLTETLAQDERERL